MHGVLAQPLLQLLSLLLLLPFFCAAERSALAERRCIFDKIATNLSELPTAVVQKIPRKGEASWHVYTAATAEWAPIRIGVFAEDLKNKKAYCTAEGDVRPDFLGKMIQCRKKDVVTEEKKQILLNVLIPEAVKLHTDRLLVQPLHGAFRLPRFMQGLCSYFTVPTSHQVDGIVNIDMSLYLAAAPTQEATAAWAIPCAVMRSGRPVAGAVNINPSFIAPTREAVRATAHEIAHVLGFQRDIMLRRGMITIHRGVRGKAKTFVVSSKETRTRAREHYGCRNAPGAELEDEGGVGTSYSHWEHRNSKDELMSPLTGAGYYTALTMAAFSDLGYFRVNWSMAEPMSWGHKAGCPFLDMKCLRGGTTQFPKMFCTGRSATLTCTSDRLALGKCFIVSYEGELPHEYRYFSDTSIAGEKDMLTDFCPVIVPYNNTRCEDGMPVFMPGSRVGPQSLCLRGESLQMEKSEPIGDICAEVSCREDSVYVRYHGDETWYRCPEGESITPKRPFTSGRILCPRRMDVCSLLSDKIYLSRKHAESQRAMNTHKLLKEATNESESVNTTKENPNDIHRNELRAILEKICRKFGFDCGRKKVKQNNEFTSSSYTSFFW